MKTPISISILKECHHILVDEQLDLRVEAAKLLVEANRIAKDVANVEAAIQVLEDIGPK